MQSSGNSGHRVGLRRLDTIVFEQHLKKAISSVISFESHSIMFPRQDSVPRTLVCSEENRILLPLPDLEGNVLGIFVARGVDSQKTTPLLEYWQGLSTLISESLLHYKHSLTDPVTGLFTRHYLLGVLEHGLGLMREGLKTTDSLSDSRQIDSPPSDLQAPQSQPGKAFAGRGAIAILVIRLAALKDIVREFGYQFADAFTVELADKLMTLCPEQAIAARTGDSEFAVALPAATKKACAQLASSLAKSLGSVSLEHPLRKERVKISASIGYILYPQDIAGSISLKPAPEQARLLLRKARLAAALADEECSDWNSMQKVMAFSNILNEGGRVLSTLPLSRVVVSVGANMLAHEGQRFSVWSLQKVPVAEQQALPSGQKASSVTPYYKGEIALMDVHENISHAEIIHLGDATWNIEPGDRLVLLPDEQMSPKRSSVNLRQDPTTGFLRYGDFFTALTEVREKSDSYLLALLRLSPKHELDIPEDLQAGEGKTLFADATASGLHPSAYTKNSAANGAGGLVNGLESDGKGGFAESKRVDRVEPFEQKATDDNPEGPEGPDGVSLQSHPDQQMAEVANLVREMFGFEVLGGRYGLNSLILYHPSMHKDEAEKKYTELAAAIYKRLGLALAVGVAQHPFLDFNKNDSLDNCRKSLDYALLLPWPHVGVFDTLALNISADKKFSQGDVFGAIREYKLAILADESNGMAWNSLGICFSGLGKHSDGEHCFQRALESNAKDVMALYNLGNVSFANGAVKKAVSCFKDCLKLQPEHLFALIKLGQIAEQTGKPAEARKQFEKAAKLPGGEGVTHRHFAKLCMQEGSEAEAREHLHSALLYDPQDALALQMLAGLFLDGGEDPEMALSLTRQCVSLRPDLRSGWLEMARALDALGKSEQAREARVKAGEL